MRNSLIVLWSAVLLVSCSPMNLNKLQQGLDAVARDGAVLCSKRNIPARNQESIRGFEKDTRYFRYGNHFIANIKELEDYANSVLNNIRECWPHKTRDSKVVVFLSPNFEAYTLKNSTIFISLSAFMKLRSEDELAALIAHEYSHVILGHHNKDRFQSALGTLSAFGQSHIQSSSRDADTSSRDLLILQVTDWLFQNALFPSWNRKQESSADDLGVKLLMSAGYNGDAFVHMLKNVSDSLQEQLSIIDRVKEAKSRRHSSVEEKLESGLTLISSNLKENYEASTDRADSIRVILDSYPGRSRAPLLSSEYRKVLSSSSIMAKLNYYGPAMTAHYVLLESPRRASEILKIYDYENEDAYIHMAQFRLFDHYNWKPGAEKALLSSIESGGAPSIAYIHLSERAERAGNLAKAYQFYQALDKEFDKPAEILPELIRLAKKLDRSTYSYEFRCFKSLNQSLIEQCQR